LSRCLRLHFAGDGPRALTPAEREWLGKFSELAAAGQKSLLNRYRLLDVLLQQLGAMKSTVESDLTARSPLQHHPDADQELRDRWEDELRAAIEAEYRGQRSDLMLILQRWLRDVWLQTLAKCEGQSPKSKVQGQRPGVRDQRPEVGGAEFIVQRSTFNVENPKSEHREPEAGLSDGLLDFPELAGPKQVAARISPYDALENLEVMETTQRLLYTNVQEALALEVGLLKLHF
jgi:hypothetical protein